MWAIRFRQLPHDNSHEQTLWDLFERVCRRLIVLLAASTYIGLVLLAPPKPGGLGWEMLGIAGGWLGVCLLAYWLVPRRPVPGLVVFLGGLAIALTLVIALLEAPWLAALYPVVSLLAVMLLGWPGGVGGVTATAVLLVLLTARGLLPAPPNPLAPAIFVVSLLLVMAGWIVTDALVRATGSALASLEQAQAKLAEARAQRLELKQAQEDLLQADREHMRLVERLKAMNQVAEEARQAKQEFIANVSHELRTPLNLIISYSDLITQSPRLYGDKLPSPLLADVAVIQRNSQHLSKLVDDVLDLSQIEAGRMAISREWAQIDEIVHGAVEVVAPLFLARELTLAVAIAADLPGLYCDKLRIRQVLINLLSNAGRFVEQGGVTVRAWREDTHIQVSITDSGPGIKPEDQARLFEPFQQLDTSIRRRHGGSGLGVNISKHFVEMHGGRIWMESQLGVGTTFVVSLPIALPDPGGGDGGSARRWINPYQEYVPRTRLRVAPVPEMSARYIVLEQGQVLSRLLRRYLQDAEVVSATTWQTALELAAESPPTAFLVNTAAQPTMPWAHDAAGDVAQNGVPFDTPLFACWLPDDASRQLGVQRYLVKPVSGLALFDAVRDVCPTARTILIADDEPDLLRMFRRVLAAAEGEYRVMTAESGVDALALLRETAPDLLILDLIMPGMTGFDLLKEKAQDPALAQIPVIVISSRDPNQQPIVSTQLLVARGGGLSARTLLDCVQALTGLLAPTSRPLRPAPPGVEGA